MEDFARILAGAGVKVAAPALERGYEVSGAFLAEVWRRHRDVPVTDHVRALLDGVDRGLSGRVPPDVLAALVDAYARPVLVVPPALDTGAPGALAALRARGLTLAVVSNTMRTPGSTLRRLLEQQGILDCFAHTTFSDEVGVRKPDPAIFDLTLRALGCDAASAVHVGDDPVLDVSGARAAGMRVIQVTNAPPARGRPQPDLVIPSLSALAEAVTRLDS
jgi:HAD superfamily hydrolase (TIGR01509 family)